MRIKARGYADGSNVRLSYSPALKYLADHFSSDRVEWLSVYRLC